MKEISFTSMDLKTLRKKIDDIDTQIVELLNQRAQTAIEVGKQKKNKPVYDPTREKQVLDLLKKNSNGTFPEDALVAVYKEVISACRSLQYPEKIAFLGPEGTFSHLAAKNHFGTSATFHATSSIESVFESVLKNECQYGIAPLENSYEGSVKHTMNCLIHSKLQICGQFFMKINHALISSQPDLSKINQIYSHPQALAQCRSWLSENLPHANRLESSSTAAAAKIVNNNQNAAAIANPIVAHQHNLSILKTDIQDSDLNETRFIVLSKNDCPITENDQTSLVLWLKDQKGALLQVLKLFDDANINLSLVESHPSSQRAWEMVFFVDFDGHREQTHVSKVLTKLEKCCEKMITLGSYAKITKNKENS